MEFDIASAERRPVRKAARANLADVRLRRHAEKLSRVVATSPRVAMDDHEPVCHCAAPKKNRAISSDDCISFANTSTILPSIADLLGMAHSLHRREARASLSMALRRSSAHDSP